MRLLTAVLRSITNDAEVQAEFEAKRLNLARLQLRSEISKKDVMSLLRLASQNVPLWRISLPYAIAIPAFSALSWALSLVFVLESQLTPYYDTSRVNITLGIDVPKFPDACRSSLTAPNCTYDLASSALTSQFITRTPYTFNNVTFSGPNGTQAIPVGAMQQFANLTKGTRFNEEKSQYCLPVLQPNLVSCTAVSDEHRAKYTYVGSRYDTYLKASWDTYEVLINPDSEYNQTYVVTGSEFGVMAVSHSKKPAETSLTILTGIGRYADTLSRLSSGSPMTWSNDTYNETQYTVLCDAPYNNHTYSWQWVNFTLTGGVMSPALTNVTCAQNNGSSPMGWLDYALEQATALSSLRDGYSKLLNEEYLASTGPAYERMQHFGMSPLEYICSQIVGIVLTAWTATNTDIAKTTPVTQRTYQHRYAVTVQLQGVTILALGVACVILLCTLWQAWRWTAAELAMRSGRSRTHRTWQLLDPLQLLAYGAVAAGEVSKLGLKDEEQRKKVLRDRHGPVLGCGSGSLVPLAATEMDLVKRSRGMSSASAYLDGHELIGWDSRSLNSRPSPGAESTRSLITRIDTSYYDPLHSRL